MSWRAEEPARAGFVLLEAVVALAIIGLFAIALLSTTSTQLLTASKANTLLVARSLADDRLAALRLLDYDDLGDVPDSLLEGTFPPPFEEYSWTAQVEEMEDEYDLFGVQVVVAGRGESFPIRTLIHSPSPNVAVDGQGGVTGGAAGFGGRGGRGGNPGERGAGPPDGGRAGAPGAGRRGAPPVGRGGDAGQGRGQAGQTGRGDAARGAGT